MTTLAAFITQSDRKLQGSDHNETNLYVISDSRMTWSWLGKPFDSATKIFPFRSSPNIIGYCGDSTFSLSAISRIKLHLEFSTKFLSLNPIDKSDFIQAYLDSAANNYESKYQFTKSAICFFTYFNGKFYGYEFSSTTGAIKFNKNVLQIPNEPGYFYYAGSGSPLLKDKVAAMVLKFGATVHTFFYSFFCHIMSGRDKKTGGLPQLSMIDAKGKLKPIGIISGGKVTFLGEENNSWLNEPGVEFRNERFQLLDSMGNVLSHEKNRDYLSCY